MFGIGSTEFLVILVVALLVLGPKNLAKVSRTFGKYMGEFRRVSTNFQRTLNAEVADEERKDARNSIREKAEAARQARARRLASQPAGERAAASPAAPVKQASAAPAAPAASPAPETGSAESSPAAAAPVPGKMGPESVASAEIPPVQEGSPLDAALKRAAAEAEKTGSAQDADGASRDAKDARA